MTTTSWLFIAACWVFSCLFNGIEAAALALDPVRLRHHAKLSNRAAMRLSRLVEQPERLLVTVLLVTNFANILALVLLTRLFVRAFGLVGYVAAAIVAIPVYLFLTGILPKSIFRRFPFRTLSRLVGLLEIAMAILSPLLLIGSWLGKRVLFRNAPDHRLFAAREELKQITAQSEAAGELSGTGRQMIHNIVDFGAVKVRDVMVPLAKTIAISPATSVADVLALSREKNVDRVPVIAAGEPVGLVNVIDILVAESQALPLRSYQRRIVIAAEDEPAYRIIRRLRAARLSLAAVIDENHKLAGVVTLEEMVQRLVSTTPVTATLRN